MTGPNDADVCQHCQPGELIYSDDVDMTHSMLL